MVSPEKRNSCQRGNHNKQTAKSYSQYPQTRRKQRQTTTAFFPSSKTPAGRSSMSKRSTVPHGAGPSLNNHQSRIESDTGTHVSRVTKVSQGQSPGTRSVRPSVRPSKSLNQSDLAPNTLRHSHSLSADIVVPQRVQSANRYEKPLPEPPQPGSTTSSVGEECRLSTEADTLPSTPEKHPRDKGQGNAPQDKEDNHYNSSISPNHVTVCSRGFSGHKIGWPNVPKRMSSIRSLQKKTREYDQGEILDRDVLRGLHIAASAACNEQIDAFIREKTGLHIRRFLSDLMPLESLGNNPARDVKERRAKRRKAEIREVKRRVRRSRQARGQAML
jgi:hypothetical protein